MKLYIDDTRPAPDESWTLVRTITEAIRIIDEQWLNITEISLDYDCGDGVETFEPVARFIDLKSSRHFEGLPHITIHSQNPVGAEKLKNILGI